MGHESYVSSSRCDAVGPAHGQRPTLASLPRTRLQTSMPRSPTPCASTTNTGPDTCGRRSSTASPAAAVERACTAGSTRSPPHDGPRGRRGTRRPVATGQIDAAELIIPSRKTSRACSLRRLRLDNKELARCSRLEGHRQEPRQDRLVGSDDSPEHDVALDASVDPHGRQMLSLLKLPSPSEKTAIRGPTPHRERSPRFRRMCGRFPRPRGPRARAQTLGSTRANRRDGEAVTAVTSSKIGMSREQKDYPTVTARQRDATRTPRGRQKGFSAGSRSTSSTRGERRLRHQSSSPRNPGKVHKHRSEPTW